MNNTWRYTINSDRFTDKNKEHIIKLWKDDPNCIIGFKGAGYKEFITFINSEFTNILQVDNNHFSLI